MLAAAATKHILDIQACKQAGKLLLPFLPPQLTWDGASEREQCRADMADLAGRVN